MTEAPERIPQRELTFTLEQIFSSSTRRLNRRDDFPIAK
ncbi:MAG: hypothetical protein BWX46_00569 [Candidatus Cloacimonetes bacterium ADurb.Bin003]|nr:MAG: hypothetical protein BWX46_00569 [Candidatus Cloacimonetes bacterium ADurb.Bin003]